MAQDLIEQLKNLDEFERDIVEDVILQGRDFQLGLLCAGVHKTSEMLSDRLLGLVESGVLAEFKHCGLSFQGPISLFFEVTS